MPSPTAGQVSELRRRIARAEGFLREAQTADGLWPDFVLEPGASDAWTTAVVAFALAQPPVDPESMTTLRTAADALHRLPRAGGWGYNLRAAPDADSTAWVLRFLGYVDDLRGLDAPTFLQRFLDEAGAAHTFRGAEFGTWRDAHADVTPVAGLALVAVAAPAMIVERVRSAVLAALGSETPWRAFWWTADAYAVARNLEFLAASGGVPDPAANVVRAWLPSVSPGSGLEAAQLLTCAVLTARKLAPLHAARLLRLQRADGSWAPSPTLLVPSQSSGERSPAAADVRASFTTAMAVLALKQHLRASARVDRGRAERPPRPGY